MLVNVPSPLPDECLRSYGHRVYLVNKSSKRGTSSLLKDLIDAGLSIDCLIRQHSHLGYARFVYSKFCYQNITRHADVLKNSWSVHGRIPTRVARYCEQCSKEDVAEFGLSYWRRSHQLPGLAYCSKHTSPLLGVDAACLANNHPMQAGDICHPVAVISESQVDSYLKSPVIRRFTNLSLLALDRATSFNQYNIADTFRNQSRTTTWIADSNLIYGGLQDLPTGWVDQLFSRSMGIDKIANILFGLTYAAHITRPTAAYLLLMAIMWSSPVDALKDCVANADKRSRVRGPIESWSISARLARLTGLGSCTPSLG